MIDVEQNIIMQVIRTVFARLGQRTIQHELECGRNYNNKYITFYISV